MSNSKVAVEVERSPKKTTPSKPYNINNNSRPFHSSSFYSSSSSSSSSSMFSPNKFYIYIIVTCAIIFLLFQIQALNTPPSSSSSSSWPAFLHNYKHLCFKEQELVKSMATKLRDSITFLPLKDLRYSSTALQGHTWFMSSMYDTQEQGEVQFQQFPSKFSKGRLLCVMGKDTHDGSWNSYALAWPEALPYNATMLEGLTFVSYNHYNYDNIWHGLSAMVPFVAWHRRSGCKAVPARWVLYHWGEVRGKMGGWLEHLMKASFGENGVKIETFEVIEGPVCFEEAVVMRHNEGGMSRERRIEVYDLLRCRAREYCKVKEDEKKRTGGIGMTMFMRSGPRSFRNESAVVKIFERECLKVDGCKLRVAHSSNLSFCEQVGLMGETDILISPHGAQLTNMFLMDKNSSVMEFFPKGWLKLAGVGQYVYHWIASWSGMRHQGAWRDPNGDPCPYPEDDRRCMSIYKGGLIGYNETHFSQWAHNVLIEAKMNKKLEQDEFKNTHKGQQQMKTSSCDCN